MVRRSIVEIPGFRHANPIPAASRIGPWLFSGVLTGRDPQTGEMPTGLSEQCANVFAHVRALLAAAGGTMDDVAKMTFWLAAYRDRDALNRHWLAAFPDPGRQPARQCMAAQLDRGSLIQCDLIAVLEDP